MAASSVLARRDLNEARVRFNIGNVWHRVTGGANYSDYLARLVDFCGAGSLLVGQSGQR
jgi:hypothetical protein